MADVVNRALVADIANDLIVHRPQMANIAGGAFVTNIAGGPFMTDVVGGPFVADVIGGPFVADVIGGPFMADVIGLTVVTDIKKLQSFVDDQFCLTWHSVLNLSLLELQLHPCKQRIKARLSAQHFEEWRDIDVEKTAVAIIRNAARTA